MNICLFVSLVPINETCLKRNVSESMNKSNSYEENVYTVLFISKKVLYPLKADCTANCMNLINLPLWKF